MNKIIHGIEVNDNDIISFLRDAVSALTRIKAELLAEEKVLIPYTTVYKNKKTNTIDRLSFHIFKVLPDNPNKKDRLKAEKALQIAFGEDITQDEDFKSIFEKGLVTYPGIEISMPTNNEEVIDLLIKVRKIISNTKIPDHIRDAYIDLSKEINNKIGEYLLNAAGYENDCAFLLNNCKTILNALNQKKHIEISSEEFYNMLGVKLSIVLVKEGNKIIISGEDETKLIKEFIGEHNNKITEEQKAQEEAKNQKEKEKAVLKMANSYFKKLKKIPLEKLEFSDFPSFDEPEFLPCMFTILEKLEKKNAESSELYSIASLRIIHYYRDLNGKEEKLACSK